MSKIILAIVGDTHINSTVALRIPIMKMDDGSTNRASKLQQEYWNAWIDFCNQAKDKARGGKLIAVFNGDTVELDTKNRSHQVHTRNPATVIDVAYRTLEPMLDIAKEVYWMRGTEAHVGKSASMEELLAADCTKTIRKNGTASWWDLRMNVQGVLIDISHHTNMGTTLAGRGNAAARLAIRTMEEYSEWGEPAPKIAIRGHVHTFSDSGLTYPVRALTHGCWTATNSYSHRIGLGGRMPHIGGLFITIEDGKYNIEKVQYEYKREKAEIVN